MLTTIVYSAIILYGVVSLLLEQCNRSSITARFEELSGSVRSVIEREVYEKSQEYALAKSTLRCVRIVWGVGLLLVLLVSGVPGIWDVYLRSILDEGLLRGAVYIVSLSFLLSLLDLPFGWYATFRLEERFGFNRTTYKTWAMDLIKGTIVSLVIVVPLLLGVLWCMERAGSLWWIYTWMLIAVVQLVLLFVFPVWIAPLFNTFTPLEDGELKESLLALADGLGFETAGVMVADGSRRSAHANAYFAGFGSNRRIVLFDSLLELLKTSELCAVLAHEIGHAKCGHIKKGIKVSLTMLLAGLALLAYLVESPALYELGGIQEPATYTALFMFSLLSEPFGFFLKPLSSALSRVHEYEADRYAVEAMGEADSLESGLLALSKESLVTLNPHPWYSTFHYSHPALLERISAMQEYAQSVFPANADA